MPQLSVTRSVKSAVVAAHAAMTSAKTWPLPLGAIGLSVTVTELTVALVPPLTASLSAFWKLWSYLFTAIPNISKCAPRSNGPEPTKARAGYSLPK